jgi:molybdopterin/thiamine biosynthesis adenylyltransferase
LSANAPLEHPLHARTVLIAGLGNIGSPLPALLARAGVGLIRVVDRDRVEEKNLSAQDYRPADIGRFKAEVHAERLRELFPRCRIECYCVDLEDLPAGLADVDLALGGLDSRRARQVLAGDLAWPLGVPLIDGGVGDGGLGRVQVFVPGVETACLECTWGSADYRLASAEYPCVPGGQAALHPTGAPAYLGTFTASLMAAEAVRVLDRRPAESYEIAFDLNNLALRRFALRRNPRCRHDHAVTTETLPAGDSVADLLSALDQRFGKTPVRLQARRGVGRFLTVEALRARQHEPLAALGLVPGDRIRAFGSEGSAWLCVGTRGGE